MAYATETDYAIWTGLPVAPTGTLLRLKRASAFLDTVLIGAVYPVDSNGLPTVAEHAAALRDAACAQVEYWAGTGDADGTGASSEWDDVSVGSVRLTRGSRGLIRGPRSRSADGGSDRQVAPLAADLLRNAGLLTLRPYAYG